MLRCVRDASFIPRPLSLAAEKATSMEDADVRWTEAETGKRGTRGPGGGGLVVIWWGVRPWSYAAKLARVVGHAAQDWGLLGELTRSRTHMEEGCHCGTVAV